MISSAVDRGEALKDLVVIPLFRLRTLRRNVHLESSEDKTFLRLPYVKPLLLEYGAQIEFPSVVGNFNGLCVYV